MKAYQLVEWQQPPEFRDIPVPPIPRAPLSSDPPPAFV